MSGDFIRGNAALEAAKALNVIVHDHQSITFEGIPYYLVNAYEYDDWKMEHQAILTAAPTEEGERVTVWHEAVEAMREIVSYLRSEYLRYRFPVPEHYVDTVEAALKAGQRCKHDGTLVDLLTVAKTKYPAGSPEWDAVTQLVFNIEDHLDCPAKGFDVD